MRRRITVEYDGSDFVGWQSQPGERSVQGELEAALATVLDEPVRLYGAGRTDAGVHAEGQVAHFDGPTRMAPIELRNALNSELGSDLAIRDVRPVADDFDARRHATQKRYVYRVLNRAEPSPLRAGRVWHRRQPLDADGMRRAAASLLGTHDFSAYRGARGGADPDEDPVRTLERLDLVREGDEWHWRAEGRSFLRYMVRNLVGTLTEIGHRQKPPEAASEILASRDRTLAGPTAPAAGLCLAWVRYDTPPKGAEAG